MAAVFAVFEWALWRAMPIEGPLTELGIQDVLQLLDLTRKTGVLTVRSERNHDEAIIVFDRGAIVAGRRADLVHVRKDTAIPLVRGVWRQGRRVA